MADDRDRLRRRTPPAGIRAQTAAPLGVDWENEPTPPPSSVPEALEAVHRRQKQTQQTTQSTLDRVGDLRSELGGRIDRLDGRVDGLTEQGARVEGKMDVLTDVVARSLDEQTKIHISRVSASIDVERSQAVAMIGQRTERAGFPRQLALKVVAIAGPVIAAILSFAAGRC